MATARTDDFTEWLHGAKPLTAEEVKKQPIGTKVILHGIDRHGEHTMMSFQIVKQGKSKILYGHDGYGYPLYFRIKDYPNKRYTLDGSVK